MSTMLRSAVMSLLSKTLQTFLYKYLSDVDVEGVAMPSLMDVNGQSGWGVRLSNVKLREGVELMTLPGKRKRKKRKPTKEEQDEKDTQQEQRAQGDNNEIQQSETTIPAAARVAGDEKIPATATMASASVMNVVGGSTTVPSASVVSQSAAILASSASASSPPPARGRLLTEEDTCVDSNVSSRAPSPTRVICASGKGSSVLACFQKGEGIQATSSEDEDEIEELDTDKQPSNAGSSNENNVVQTNVVFNTDDVDGEKKGIPEATVVQGEPLPGSSSNTDGVDNAGVRHGPGTANGHDDGRNNRTGSGNGAGGVGNDDENHDNNGDDDNDDDEFTTFEQDMVLRLGVGGRIGTLDVR